MLLTFAIYAVLFGLITLLALGDEAGFSGAMTWSLGFAVQMTLAGQLWLRGRIRRAAGGV